MITKEQAIKKIIALIKDNKITLEEITSAIGHQQLEANKKDGFTLVRLFSYLGGIFILFGLSAYITIDWDNLNSFSRIIITLGSGITSLIIAVVLLSQNNKENYSIILIILSALLQATGLFVTVVEFSKGGGDVLIAAMIIFGILASEYGILFLKLKRTVLLFFMIYFATASFVSIADFIDIPRNLTEFIVGVSLVIFSYVIQRTPYNIICGFGYFVGNISLLWMSFDLLQHTFFEISYIGITCYMLYVSTIVRSRSILATSTIAMFLYLAYFTKKHFLNSIGWPISMMLLGVIFFGISGLALKINNRLLLREQDL